MEHGSHDGLLFEGFFRKPVPVRFDGEAESSDGRQAGQVAHDRLSLLRQRVYGLAAGYADGNDAAHLAVDPALKIACGRQPLSGADLASQPTLSRFENAATARALVTMGRRLEQKAIGLVRRRHRKPGVIGLDLDGTDDPVHGHQQQTFFNAYYDRFCFQPLLALVSVDGDPEHYLLAARLRPGNSSQCRGVIPLLRRTVARLRRVFRRAEIRVRLDAGFAHPRLLAEQERLRVGLRGGISGQCGAGPSGGQVAGAGGDGRGRGGPKRAALRGAVVSGGEAGHESGAWCCRRRCR